MNYRPHSSPNIYFNCHLFNICDTIKGIRSHTHVEDFQDCYTTFWQHTNASFWCKLHMNWMSGYRVMSNLSLLKTIENKEIWTLSWPISQKQYLRHQTHFTWPCSIVSTSGFGIRGGGGHIPFVMVDVLQKQISNKIWTYLFHQWSRLSTIWQHFR